MVSDDQWRDLKRLSLGLSARGAEPAEVILQKNPLREGTGQMKKQFSLRLGKRDGDDEGETIFASSNPMHALKAVSTKEEEKEARGL